MQSCDWCFTLSRDSEYELIGIQEGARYFIIGLEEGESGYQHYQGFVQYPKKMRLNALKRKAPTAHFEAREGTVQQAVDYCKKDGLWYDHGKMMTQGQRTDIEEFIEDAKTQDRCHMYINHPSCMVRYSRAYNDIKSSFAQAAQAAEIHWIFGPSGCGKTSYPMSKHPGLYIKSPNDQWWQGYTSQEVVLIDEISSGMPFHDLLLLGSPGVHRFATKGGDIVPQARIVYITSNSAPDRVYATDASDEYRWNALLRRSRFYICSRLSSGRSRLTEVDWKDGWQASECFLDFDVDISYGRPRSLCVPYVCPSV